MQDSWEIKKPIEDHILIIDFMNYVHRGVINNLDGEFVLIYNFFRNFRATVEKFNPTKIIFALEGNCTWRKELYPEYKANRIIKTGTDNTDKIDKKEKLIKDANRISELLKLLPVYQCCNETAEADDVIATLTENLQLENTTVISSDQDLIQLLQKGYAKLKLFAYSKKDYVNVPEENFLFFKILIGDKSDNIPSVCGKKTAEKLLKNPEKLKEFMEVEENRASVMLNRQLIELKSLPLESLEFIEPETNFDSLKTEFELMKFDSITNEDSWRKFITTFKNLI